MTHDVMSPLDPRALFGSPHPFGKIAGTNWASTFPKTFQPLKSILFKGNLTARISCGLSSDNLDHLSFKIDLLEGQWLDLCNGPQSSKEPHYKIRDKFPVVLPNPIKEPFNLIRRRDARL